MPTNKLQQETELIRKEAHLVRKLVKIREGLSREEFRFEDMHH